MRFVMVIVLYVLREIRYETHLTVEREDEHEAPWNPIFLVYVGYINPWLIFTPPDISLASGE